MAISFPANPQEGDEYTYNDRIYTFNGVTWTAPGSGGGGGTSYDEAADSTGYFGLPVGTTAQRPGTPAAGMARYNSSLGAAEFYTATGWAPYGGLSIANVSPSVYNGEANVPFYISGTGFFSGTAVRFLTSSGTPYTAGTVVINSQNSITAYTPQEFTSNQGPLSVQVESSTGLSLTAVNAISTGTNPSWTTSAGSLANLNDVERVIGTMLSVVAADSELDGNVTYSVVSGSLPGGLVFNASNATITGIADEVLSETTSTFTVRADDGVNYNDRSFSITVKSNTAVNTQAFAYTGALQSFQVPANVDYIRVHAWGAGGAGGRRGGWSFGAPGGGGGYATAVIPVQEGEVYYILVGGQGAVGGTTSAFGGGGPVIGGNDNRYGSAGGGYSGVFSNNGITQANAMIIAGGGGGGGASRSGTGNSGGAGGGETGQDGGAPYNAPTGATYRGQGGTQVAAGGVINNQTSGQGPLQGGTATAGSGYGGGGGGGWYGGSAGGYIENSTMAGGGGGSGYILSNLYAQQLLGGLDAAAGNNNHPLRETAGTGGADSSVGTHGRVVIQY